MLSPMIWHWSLHVKCFHGAMTPSGRQGPQGCFLFAVFTWCKRGRKPTDFFFFLFFSILICALWFVLAPAVCIASWSIWFQLIVRDTRFLPRLWLQLLINTNKTKWFQIRNLDDRKNWERRHFPSTVVTLLLACWLR